MKVEDTADEALVALARTGDKDAFGSLIERYQPLVASLVRKMVTDEYLVQQALKRRGEAKTNNKEITIYLLDILPKEKT